MNGNYISKEDLLESADKGGFKELEDGTYSSQVVAVVKKELTAKGKINIIYELLFELRDEENETHYVRSKALKASLYEKANLYKMMAQWLKQSAPTAIVEALEKSGIIDDKGFNFFNFVGKQARITVVSTPSTGNPDKSYPSIMGMAPAKVEYELNDNSEIPSFFLKGLEVSTLVNLKIKEVNTNSEPQSEERSYNPQNTEPPQHSGEPDPEDPPY